MRMLLIILAITGCVSYGTMEKRLRDAKCKQPTPKDANISCDGGLESYRTGSFKCYKPSKRRN